MIFGWGRWSAATGRMLEADDPAMARRMLGENPSLIPRGAGRAYGDAALSHHAMLAMPRADHILAFDRDLGEIEVEAGAILADLLPFLLSEKFFVPVTPGTAQVTIGGMVAADVHGKNHQNAGTFGRHVIAITLLLAHMFLESKTTSLIDSLEIASVKFLNSITERQHEPAAATQPPTAPARAPAAARSTI